MRIINKSNTLSFTCNDIIYTTIYKKLFGKWIISLQYTELYDSTIISNMKIVYYKTKAEAIEDCNYMISQLKENK